MRRLSTALAAAVPVGFVTLLLFVPYVLLLVQSFWQLRGGTIVHHLTLENYRRLIGTALYPETIVFSAGIALRVTGLSLLLAYPLAYLLPYKMKRHRTPADMGGLIPFLGGYLVGGDARKIIFGPGG